MTESKCLDAPAHMPVVAAPLDELNSLVAASSSSSSSSSCSAVEDGEEDEDDIDSDVEEMLEQAGDFDDDLGSQYSELDSLASSQHSEIASPIRRRKTSSTGSKSSSATTKATTRKRKTTTKATRKAKSTSKAATSKAKKSTKTSTRSRSSKGAKPRSAHTLSTVRERNMDCFVCNGARMSYLANENIACTSCPYCSANMHVLCLGDWFHKSASRFDPSHRIVPQQGSCPSCQRNLIWALCVQRASHVPVYSLSLSEYYHKTLAAAPGTIHRNTPRIPRSPSLSAVVLNSLYRPTPTTAIAAPAPAPAPASASASVSVRCALRTASQPVASKKRKLNIDALARAESQRIDESHVLEDSDCSDAYTSPLPLRERLKLRRQKSISQVSVNHGVLDESDASDSYASPLPLRERLQLRKAASQASISIDCI
jgi:Structure-specific endonuclease subunit SLX1, C-terminal